MLKSLAHRLRNSDSDIKLLIPLLISTALAQGLVVLIRVTTSYRVVELGLSSVWLGVISATFALLPIGFALWVGRVIDRGYDAQMLWAGSGLVAASSGLFIIWPTPALLIAASALMGVGHLMVMASHQLLCVRAAGPKSMESVFGNYMVAGAIGQGLGPYIVGLVGGAATLPPTAPLFIAGFALAVISLLVGFAVRPAPARPKETTETKVVPVGELLRTPGVAAVIVAGVIMVASADVLLIYVPLLGAERNIDVRDIGLLLTVRAIASMIARLFYARMIYTFGRWSLLVSTTLICAGTFGALAIPLPLWAMHIVMAIMGASFGIAATLSISTVVMMTTAEARGTGNSLRIMGNRLGQFAMPLGGGVFVAMAGITGLFGLIGAAIAASGLVVYWQRPRKPDPS